MNMSIEIDTIVQSLEDCDEITMSIYGNGLGFRKIRKERKDYIPPNVYNNEDKKLFTLVNRRRNGLIKAISRIKSDPSCFLTLNMRKMDKEKIHCLKENMFKFFAKIRLNYSDSWFIYKCEYTMFSGFHVHLIGDFIKDDCTIFNKKKEIYLLWSSITGFKFKNLVDIRSFSPRHYSYLIKPEKKKNDANFISYSGQTNIWGFINRKNVKFYETYNVKLSKEEAKVFFTHIYLYLKKQGVYSYRTFNQFVRDRGCLSLIPNEIIEEELMIARLSVQARNYFLEV